MAFVKVYSYSSKYLHTNLALWPSQKFVNCNYPGLHNVIYIYKTQVKLCFSILGLAFRQSVPCCDVTPDVYRQIWQTLLNCVFHTLT